MTARPLVTGLLSSVTLFVALASAGCGPGPAPKGKVGVAVNVDGSNTVYPIMEAAASAHRAVSKTPVTVGKAGTGAGMKKFIAGEIDIADASRPIKKDEDVKLKSIGKTYIEVAIAYDGLCIVVSPKNTWLKSITLDQLHKIWDKSSTVRKWNEVDPTWPDAEIKLVGPTSAHGTYEYFNEVVNKSGKNTRQDYSQQAEYDGIVGVVGRDENALGYMGFSYAELNADKVRVIPVDAGKGPVTPTKDSILEGSYAPFSRPLLLYIDAKALDTKESLLEFAQFVLDPQNAVQAVTDAGYVPLPDDLYEFALDRLAKRTVGSLTLGAAPGTPYRDLAAKKA